MTYQLQSAGRQGRRALAGPCQGAGASIDTEHATPYRSAVQCVGTEVGVNKHFTTFCSGPPLRLESRVPLGKPPPSGRGVGRNATGRDRSTTRDYWRSDPSAPTQLNSSYAVCPKNVAAPPPCVGAALEPANAGKEYLPSAAKDRASQLLKKRATRRAPLLTRGGGLRKHGWT